MADLFANIFCQYIEDNWNENNTARPDAISPMGKNDQSPGRYKESKTKTCLLVEYGDTQFIIKDQAHRMRQWRSKVFFHNTSSTALQAMINEFDRIIGAWQAADGGNLSTEDNNNFRYFQDFTIMIHNDYDADIENFTLNSYYEQHGTPATDDTIGNDLATMLSSDWSAPPVKPTYFLSFNFDRERQLQGYTDSAIIVHSGQIEYLPSDTKTQEIVWRTFIMVYGATDLEVFDGVQEVIGILNDWEEVGGGAFDATGTNVVFKAFDSVRFDFVHPRAAVGEIIFFSGRQTRNSA